MGGTLTHDRKVQAWMGTAILLLFLSVAIAGWSVSQEQSAQMQTCHAINRLDAVITQTLKRSKANLPKLSYFQANPSELASQEREIDREIEAFRPTSC